MVSKNRSDTRAHSPRVARKRLERQEKIVDTAMRLLGEGGLANVTVGRLATELDLTPGALYRYFPSMDALLAHMQCRAIDALRRRVLDAIENAGGVPLPLERLRAVANAYLDTSKGDAVHHLSLISQMLAAPHVLISDAMATQTIPKLAELLRAVEALIADAQASGDLSEGSARGRAVQLWAALQGAVALNKLTRFEPTLFSAPAVGRELLENLLVAWSASDNSCPPSQGIS